MPTTLTAHIVTAWCCLTECRGRLLPDLCLIRCAAGATAFLGETGLGQERLYVCNLTASAFVGCKQYSGFSMLRSSYSVGNTVW